MSNEFSDFEVAPEKSKKTLIIGAIAAVVVIVVIIALIVASSPKNTLLRMMKNAQPTAEEAMDKLKDNDFADVQGLSSSQKTTVEYTDDLGLTDELGGKVVMDIEAGYLTENGDGMIKVTPKLGTMGSFDVGIYLEGSKIGLVSEDVLGQPYVLNTNQELDLDDIMLADRLVNLFGVPSSNDKQMQKYQQAVMNQVKPYIIRLVKDIPNGLISTDRKSIDLFGEKKKTACIEVTFTDDEFVDYIEPILEDMLDDDKLIEAYENLSEYQLENTKWLYDLMYMDIDDAQDIEELLEELLESLDDVEFDELTLRFYHQGKTPVAVDVYYEDEYTEFDSQVVVYSKGDDAQASIIMAIDGEELDMSFVRTDGDYLIEMDIPEVMQYEIAMIETKDGYDIEGNMEMESYGATATAEIVGTMVEDKNTITSTVEYEFDFDGEKATGTMEMVQEQVRKNEEYTLDLEYTIDMYDGEFVMSMESELFFGKKAELDMASLDDGFEIDLTDSPENVYMQFSEAATQIEDAVYEFMFGLYY